MSCQCFGLWDEALGLLPIDLSGPQPQEGQIMMTSMGTGWLHRA